MGHALIWEYPHRRLWKNINPAYLINYVGAMGKGIMEMGH